MSNILLTSGREVDPFEMTEDDLDIHDIAHSLSMQCRYAGHVPFFYSVAEHCVRAVELMAQDGQLSRDDLRGHKTARSILLHDADEAYLQDLVSPVKNRPEMEAYRNAGDRIHDLVATKYECLPMVDGQHHFMVKAFDVEAYLWERENIRSGQISGLSPATARASFLGMWYLVRPRGTEFG